MSSNDDFGEKHSHFRFHFATNTLLSREQEETVERESDTEMVLKLSGFPADDVISTGWRVQPLRMPPLVSEQCNVIIKVIYDINFIYRSTEEMSMILINQRVLVLHIFLY